jgi:two-component system phosphate regulon sensor histidine kinase PhoR
MGILGIYLANSFRDSQLDSLRIQLESEARIIAETSLPIITGSMSEGNLDILAKRLGEQISARVTIIALDGVVLGDSEEDPSVMDNHGSRPEVKAALTTGLGESTRFSMTLEQKMMYIAVPISSQDQVFGISRVSLPLTDVENLVNRMTVIIIVAMIVATITVVLASWIVTRMTTRPIKEVTDASRKIAEGELQQKINIDTSDEAGELAQAFNQMSMKLKDMVHTISADRTRLTSILDHMADGLLMIDSESKLATVNRAAKDILIIEEDINSKTLIEVVREHELNDLVRVCIETGHEQSVQFETSALKKYLRAIAVPITDGQTTSVLVLLQDLTQLRGLQTTRRELIGNISHDFRTPLAGIKAMVETLRDSTIEDKEITTDFLSRIEAEVDRLAQMVSELTELSRIETGRAELKLEKVKINQLADEAITQLSPQAKRKQLTVSKKYASDMPELNVDRARIVQAITNLIHNAIKFTPSDGKILITTNVMDNSVCIAITDTGTGIAENDLPRIFERFYKVDRARSGEGTGMGLAIVKHIVESHGGSIQVESQEGKGSTFSFCLPYKSTSK